MSGVFLGFTQATHAMKDISPELFWPSWRVRALLNRILKPSSGHFALMNQVPPRKPLPEGGVMKGLPMNLRLELARAHTRRQFLKNCQTGIGALALASLLRRDGRAAPAPQADNPLAPRKPHFTPKA